MKLVVWDLDNCLADDGWRIKFIDWSAPTATQRYANYHDLSIMDHPANLNIFRKHPEEPLFITGRPVALRNKTITWIQYHLDIPFPRLLMRPNEDERPAQELKHDLLTAEVERLRAFGGVEIVRAYDDHPEVIAAYRALGIDSHPLTIHSINAYAAPEEAANE